MTIEQIRNLPKDNWLGIKRVGEHAWQIGESSPSRNTMLLVTGDGGVVQYVETLLKEMKGSLELPKPIPVGKGLLEQVDEGSPSTYKPEDLTYEKLEKIVKEAFDGLAKD